MLQLLRARDILRFAVVSFAVFLFSQSQIAHAEAVGAVAGQFSVSESGAATYTIPISVPPGTAGMEPKLALSYNSQAGDGLLGMGWSLSGLSVIHRCPATVAQDGFKGGINYDSNDRLCLDGQRLIAVSGAYGASGTEYRTELESFLKIISYGQAGSGPAYFVVSTKNGQTLELGATEDSRIEAQGKTSARLWAVNKISDRAGNYLTVSYTETNSSGEYYPNRIDYSGNANAGLTPTNSVQFIYEVRPDVTPMYQAGSLMKTMVRLAAISVKNGADQTGLYKFDYTLSAVTSRSLLTNVRQYGTDAVLDGAGNVLGGAMPTMLFAYQPESAGGFSVVRFTTGSDTCLTSCGSWQVGDVNGDGKTDLIHITTNPGEVITWLADGAGGFSVVRFTTGSDTCLTSCGSWQAGDVNGDARRI